nr:hypothetical protein YFYBSXGO_YFYBSXGO_CDS_0004 [Microvirus sp.]CAI9750452.1 hypothetical protein NQHBVCMM_NQHBVCMM_CDS_0004 [Microvirus sp.]
MSNRLIEHRPSKPAHHSFVGLSFFFRNGSIVVITAAIICRILRNIFIRFYRWNNIYNFAGDIEFIDIREHIGQILTIRTVRNVLNKGILTLDGHCDYLGNSLCLVGNSKVNLRIVLVNIIARLLGEVIA